MRVPTIGGAGMPMGGMPVSGMPGMTKAGADIIGGMAAPVPPEADCSGRGQGGAKWAGGRGHHWLRGRGKQARMRHRACESN